MRRKKKKPSSSLERFQRRYYLLSVPTHVRDLNAINEETSLTCSSFYFRHVYVWFFVSNLHTEIRNCILDVRTEYHVGAWCDMKYFRSVS